MTDSVRQQKRKAIREKLARLPRVALGTYPTPLQPLPNLTKELKAPNLYIKRDDMTGLAFGGNKTRQLEYVLGKLMQDKPDVFVTGANIQSNWCRQATAAAVKLGIPIVLVLRNTDSQELSGNAMLDVWMGADIRFVNEPDMTLMGERRKAVIAELEAQGKRAIQIDPRAPENALGYVEMAVELDEQMEALGIAPTQLWLAAAGPTFAGLLVAARLLGWNCQLVGVTPLTWSDSTVEARIASVANQVAEILGVDIHFASDDVCILYDYIGAGYAKASPEGLEAMRIAARTDAILLDPVYTGKAMAGLIDYARKGRLTAQDTIIFVHTGGIPASFAYQDQILAAMQ